MLIETKEEQTLDQYEPTVDDRIQRVLYRLEHGETLINNTLFNGENYCILGLFAEESGIGNWELNRDMYMYFVPETNESLGSALPSSVRSYYNFITNYGDFYVGDLPTDVIEQLEFFIGYIGPEFSLMEINDIILGTNCDVNLNELLAKIIRSGAIFGN